MFVCWWRRGSTSWALVTPGTARKQLQFNCCFLEAPSPLPYPTPSLPRCLLSFCWPRFRFWRLSGKMFELLFCPTAICGENCDLLLSARDSHQLSTSSSSSPSLPATSSPSSSSWSFGSFAFCSDTYHTVWQMLHKVLLNSLEVFNEMLRFCLCHRHRHRLCHCLLP